MTSSIIVFDNSLFGHYSLYFGVPIIVVLIVWVLLLQLFLNWRPAAYIKPLIAKKLHIDSSSIKVKVMTLLWWIFFLSPFFLFIIFGTIISLKIDPYRLGIIIALAPVSILLVIYTFFNYHCRGYLMGRAAKIFLFIIAVISYGLVLVSSFCVAEIQWSVCGYSLFWPPMLIFGITVCVTRLKVDPNAVSTALESGEKRDLFFSRMEQQKENQTMSKNVSNDQNMSCPVIGNRKLPIHLFIINVFISFSFNCAYFLISKINMKENDSKEFSLTISIASLLMDVLVFIGHYTNFIGSHLYLSLFLSYIVKVLAIMITNQYILAGQSVLYFIIGTILLTNFLSFLYNIKKQFTLKNPKKKKNNTVHECLIDVSDIDDQIESLIPHPDKVKWKSVFFFGIFWVALTILFILEVIIFKDSKDLEIIPKMNISQFDFSIFMIFSSIDFSFLLIAAIFLLKDKGFVGIMTSIFYSIGFVGLLLFDLIWKPLQNLNEVRILLFPSIFLGFSAFSIILIMNSRNLFKSKKGGIKEFFFCKLNKFEYALAIFCILFFVDFLILLIIPFFFCDYRYIGLCISFLILSLMCFTMFSFVYIQSNTLLKTPLILLIASIMFWFGFCFSLYPLVKDIIIVVIVFFVTITVFSIVFSLFWIRSNRWELKLPHVLTISIPSGIIFVASIVGIFLYAKNDISFTVIAFVFEFFCIGTVLFYLLQKSRWFFNWKSYITVGVFVAFSIGMFVLTCLQFKSFFLISSIFFVIIFIIAFFGTIGHLTITSETDVIIFSNSFYPIRRLFDGKLLYLRSLSVFVALLVFTPFVWGLFASVFLKEYQFGILAASIGLMLSGCLICSLIYSFDQRSMSALKFIQKYAIEFAFKKSMRITNISINQPRVEIKEGETNIEVILNTKKKNEKAQSNTSLFMSAFKGQLSISAMVAFRKALDEIIAYRKKNHLKCDQLCNKSRHWSTIDRVKVFEIALSLKTGRINNNNNNINNNNINNNNNNNNNNNSNENNILKRRSQYDVFVQKQENQRNFIALSQLEKAPIDKKDFQNLINRLKGKKYIDTEFHPYKKISESDPTILSNAKWERMEDHYASPMVKPITPPYAIDQGAVGNCYFISAMTSISQNPHLVKDLFFEPINNECGAACVQFYFMGRRIRVIVDTLIPFTSGKARLSHPHLHQQDLPWWCSIVEKAYAKYVGSYSDIVGGNAHAAMFHLIGGWPHCYMFDNLGTREMINNGELWSKLLEWNKNGHFLCTGSLPGNDNERTATNIILGHSYSILRVVECHGNNLLQLRNTWGKAEWSGAWSQNSKKWTKRLRRELRYENNPNAEDDGRFWISFQDFIRNFISVYVCVKLEKRWKTIGISGGWKSGPKDGSTPSSKLLPAHNLKQWLIRIRRPTILRCTLEKAGTPASACAYIAYNNGEILSTLYCGDKYLEASSPTKSEVKSFEWKLDQYEKPWTMVLTRKKTNGPTAFYFTIHSDNDIEVSEISQ